MPLCGYRVRRNRGGTAVCKASIAAVLLAFGIVALFQEGTNAMIIPPAGLLPTLAIPAIETAALRRDVTVTRHVAVRHRGVTVRGRHVAVRHRGVTRTRHIAAGHRGVAVRLEPGTSQFDIEASQPVGPMLRWSGAALRL